MIEFVTALNWNDWLALATAGLVAYSVVARRG